MKLWTVIALTVGPLTVITAFPDSCSVCKMVVDKLDELLENDQVDKEISQIVEKVCTTLPVGTEAKCQSIIEAYAPYIIQMIGQMADSQSVCKEINLC